METSIRYVRVAGRSIKPALCFRGRNQAHIVFNDESCIRTISNISLKQHDEAPIVIGPIGLGHVEYPISLFVKRFQDIGQRKGVTLRAQYFLEHALEGGVKDDACLPPDTLPGEELPFPLKSEASQRGFTKLVDRIARECAPDTPQLGKPPVAPIRKPDGASRTAGATLIATIAAELKLEPTKLRKLLRAAGLNAPYTDEKLIRSKLK